ncbi:MAG: imidazole glycerol phosphate synthase subunit HisH [Cyclobacteriaceae bacterium]
MKVGIVKYNAGNVRSVSMALNRLGVEPVVSDDVEVLDSCDRIIFPGVGEASTAMKYLNHKNLQKAIPEFKMPFLGVCLGLQLMCRHTEENDTKCLNIFELNVKRFPPEKKIPHMGWNTLSKLKSPLFKGVDEGAYLYFVHSYYADTSIETIAETDYIVPFSAALQKENFYAMQAHPEKSGAIGQKILENFLSI